MESYSASVKLRGGLKLYSFETPKVLAYAETRERRVGEKKVSRCDERLLLWFDGDPKRMRWQNSEFQSRGKRMGAVLRKEDRPHQSFLAAPKIS